MTFENASPALARALAEHDYRAPTPVQAAVMKPEAEGRDILVSAQTGSGKTVAFGLAMASDLIGAGETVPDVGAPQALVIAPTRELALQVAQELRWLYAQAGARIVACVGGMDPRAERRALEAGAQIVVGTPGRLRDHLERRALNLSRLAVAALDEADEMLDMGFREDLEFILDATPEGRRTLLFSATMPKSIVALARKYQRNALRIEAVGDAGGHADIDYRAVRVDARETEKAVINLLRYYDSQTAIVFCNTRDSVRHLQAMLAGARLFRRLALRRTRPARAQPVDPGPARRPGARLRRHRRRGARPRPARPSASSSTPTCPTTPKPCSTARAAPAAPGARASASCWCRPRRGAARKA